MKQVLVVYKVVHKIKVEYHTCLVMLFRQLFISWTKAHMLIGQKTFPNMYIYVVQNPSLSRLYHVNFIFSYCFPV